MIRRCPVCLRATPYAPGDEFGCSPECRTSWSAQQVAKPTPKTLFVGDRVRVDTGWDPLDGLVGTVAGHTASGGVLVVIDGDDRPLRFSANACEVLP